MLCLFTSQTELGEPRATVAASFKDHCPATQHLKIKKFTTTILKVFDQIKKELSDVCLFHKSINCIKYSDPSFSRIMLIANLINLLF